MKLQIAALGGLDSNLFAWQGAALDEFGFPASGNKGLYGVLGSYSVLVMNSAPGGHFVDVRLEAANTGNETKYWGAASGEQGIGVPPIVVGQHVDLGAFPLDEPAAVLTTNCVGGAATTPVNLVLSGS